MQFTRGLQFACALALAACGGGGGGSDTDATGTPTASATETGTGDASSTGGGSTQSAGTEGTGTTASVTDATSDPTSTSTASGVTEASETTTTGDPTSSGSTEAQTTGAAAVTASATLAPKSGSSVSGTVLFTDAGDGTADLVIELAGVMPPGTHALHIHEFPDCSADDGESTGMHWNPNGTTLGELGTVEIAADGTGTFMKSDKWSIGTGEFDDVVGRSIIIHQDPNGGTRIACGVIAKD